jgi:hypothetical protein
MNLISLFLSVTQFFTPINPYYTDFNTNGGWLSITIQTADSACIACGDFNLIYEDPNATIGFDQLYDAYKPPSEAPTPTLFTMLPGDDFISLPNFNGIGIQGFPNLEVDSVKLGVVAYSDSAMFTFYMDRGITSATLHDKLLGEFIPIDSGSTYSFVVDSLGWHPNIDDRFVLHFHRDSTISSINEVNKDHIIRYFNLSGQRINKPSGICIRVVGTREPELILVN